MTETWGDMCPKCLSWWTSYLCKEKLYCSCEVPKEEWLFLYRKTYGNRFFGISEKKVEVTYREQTLSIYASDVVDAIGSLHLGKLKKTIVSLLLKSSKIPINKKNLIYIAFKKAFTQASSNNCFERCPKCGDYKKCRSEKKWLSVHCPEFNLKQSIKEFVEAV